MDNIPAPDPKNSPDPILLRQDIKKRRLQIPVTERARAFESILSVLFALPEYKNAKSIAAYYGKTSAGEFDTVPLLNRILYDKKKLALPRVDTQTNHLILFQITDLETDLESGVFGLIEPKNNAAHILDINQFDLILVPGLVFDQFGNRYGYGKGYYDKLLATKSAHCIKIAFVLDELVQTVEISHTSKDIPMDLIITETRIIKGNSVLRNSKT